MGRPEPVARLALTASGQVRYTLKTPYRDGTTHIVLDCEDPVAHGTRRGGAVPERAAAGGAGAPAPSSLL